MNASANLNPYTNVKLSLLGFPPVATAETAGLNDIVSTLVAQNREKERLLANHLCPVDQRIQTFLVDYLQDSPVAKLPLRTPTLDRIGMARTLSLPVGRDQFSSEIINSYRAANGVLHDPKSDRRTMQGIFYVAEGGLPIPDDKSGVPKLTFAKMLRFDQAHKTLAKIDSPNYLENYAAHPAWNQSRRIYK